MQISTVNEVAHEKTWSQRRFRATVSMWILWHWIWRTRGIARTQGAPFESAQLSMLRMRIYRAQDAISQTTYANACKPTTTRLPLFYKRLKSILFRFEHQTKANTCDLCDQRFVNETLLQTHGKHIHSEKKLECYICKRSSRTAWELQKHLRTVHVRIIRMTKLYLNYNYTIFLKPPFHCTICRKPFTSNNALNAHSCAHVEPEQKEKAKLECELCPGRTFSTGGAFSVGRLK